MSCVSALMRRLVCLALLLLAATSAGAADWFSQWLTTPGGVTFYVANFRGQASTRQELWRTDGTPAGTYRIEIAGTMVGEGALLGDDAYFLVRDGYRAFLYTSDGTAAGTRPVADLGTTETWELVSNGRALFFVSRHWIPDCIKLWTSDGTASGTKVVQQFLTDRLDELRPVASGIVFRFRTQEAKKERVLWRSDGTPEGTAPLTRSVTTSIGSWNGLAFYYHYVPSAPDSVTRTDGTPAGTFTLMLPNVFRLIGGQRFAFSRKGTALWRTDGTTVSAVQTFATEPTAVVPIDGKLFVVEAGWKSATVWGGDEAGVLQIVAELPLRPLAPHGTRTVEAARVGDELWLLVPDSDRLVLWRIDAQSGESVRGPELPANARITGATNGRLLLQADDGQHGLEAWSSDGREAAMLADVVDTPSLTGRVTEKGSGAPIAGAVVSLFAPDRLAGQTVTDANGWYAIESVPFAPRYRLLVASPGEHEPASRELTRPQPVEHFTLAPGGIVSGRVIDRTGLPVAGLRVIVGTYVGGPPVSIGITGADGRYSAGVPNGPSFIVYTSNDSGYSRVVYDALPCADNGCVGRDGGTRVGATTGSPARDVDFTVARFGIVRGRLLDAATGTPIAIPARITARRNDGADIVTGTDDGTYELALPDGLWRILVTFEGTSAYAGAWYPNIDCTSCSETISPLVHAVPGEITDGFDIRITAKSGRLEGRVVDARTGEPMQAFVQLQNADGVNVLAASTDGAGRFRLAPQPGSAYYLVVTGGGLRHVWDGTRAVPCASGSCNAAPITLAQNGSLLSLTLLLERAPIVEVRLIDAVSRAPLPNQYINVMTLNLSATWITNAEGSVTMTVSPGIFDLTAWPRDGWSRTTIAGHAADYGTVTRYDLVVEPLCPTRLFATGAVPAAGGRIKLVAESPCEACVLGGPNVKLTNACGSGTREITVDVEPNRDYQPRTLLFLAPATKLTLTQPVP